MEDNLLSYISLFVWYNGFMLEMAREGVVIKLSIVMTVGDFFVDCAGILFTLIGSVVIAGFILGFLKELICQYMQYALGFGGILITAWVGTPVHEAGHALLCYVFGHNVMDVKLFNPNSENGVLGYVNHSYNPKSIYQKIGNFFIGIAPILSGTGVIMILFRLLLPNECKSMFMAIRAFEWPGEFSLETFDLIKNSVVELFGILFTANNLKRVAFWIFMYLAICISSHMALSPADMRGASSGIGTMYILIVFVSLVIRVLNVNVTKAAGVFYILNSYFITMLVIAIFCSFCSLILSLLLYSIRNIF